MQRILVVDDDPEILSLLKWGLSYEGYAVETASNGAEALSKAREKEPDLVVLDVMMPEMDGVEVARRLRQAGDVPILMLTARGTVAAFLVDYQVFFIVLGVVSNIIGIMIMLETIQRHNLCSWVGSWRWNMTQVKKGAMVSAVLVLAVTAFLTGGVV